MAVYCSEPLSLPEYLTNDTMNQLGFLTASIQIVSNGAFFSVALSVQLSKLLSLPL